MGPLHIRRGRMEVGTEYDVFMFIYIGRDEGPPAPGTDLMHDISPVPWSVFGNRTMLPEYGDFSIIPDP